MSTHYEALDVLRDNIAALPAKDQDFARSLMKSHVLRRGLTDKQWAWVEKLAVKAIGGEPEIQVQIGEVTGIVNLFKTAASKLKYPRIDLQLEDGSKLQLMRAGKSSKEPGTITVTDGKPYGKGNRFYGRIRLDGTFVPHKDVEAHELNLVLALLAKLAADPAGTAAAYGKTTGLCCFCSTKLEADNSLSVGYGPVCASRWGLPWGKKVCS